jgi:hypothetical protein
VGAEKNKKAFVCGMGPSLKKYLDDVTNSDNVKIACSDVDLMTNIIPDYWVFANSIDGAATKMNERWKKMKDTVIVHAHSVDSTPNSWIRENVLNKYIGYDQRHFNNLDCNNCQNKCTNRVPNVKTIQELLMEISNSKRKYGTGHTVAVHCLALAILLGCKEIYLFGIDLNYNLGYVDDKTVNKDSFSYWLPEILEDFKILKESAENLNIKIYNMSEVSPLQEIFETKKTLI